MISLYVREPIELYRFEELFSILDLKVEQHRLEDQPVGIYLALDQEGLHLVSTRSKKPIRFQIDFLNDKSRYWRKAFRGKNELLAKAVGPSRVIYDFTAGLAVDTMTFVRLGFEVKAFERSPHIFALLWDAHRRALADSRFSENFERVEFFFGDGKEKIHSEKSWGKGTALYLDPMFSEERRKAKPKADLQMLRDLVGADEDANELIQMALESSAERVVVKRQGRSPWVLQEPSYELSGKSFRLDIYSR